MHVLPVLSGSQLVRVFERLGWQVARAAGLTVDTFVSEAARL